MVAHSIYRWETNDGQGLYRNRDVYLQLPGYARHCRLRTPREQGLPYTTEWHFGASLKHIHRYWVTPKESDRVNGLGFTLKNIMACRAVWSSTQCAFLYRISETPA